MCSVTSVPREQFLLRLGGTAHLVLLHPPIWMNCIRLHRRICVFYFYFSACGNLMVFFYLEENKLCKPQLSFLINVLQIRLKAWPSCSVTPNLPGMQTAKNPSVSGWGFWRVPTPQTVPCQRGIPVFNKVTQTPFVFTQRAQWIPHTHLSLKTLSNTYTKTQYTD